MTVNPNSAVREYIGARYVPIFGRVDEDSIIWDNTGTYEPLTVVLYQGNSYTSRQFVPVGIDITNEAFWALTGNYNAQVEQYRQTVYTFDGRIRTNANDISAMDDELQTTIGNVQSLQSSLNDLTPRVTHNEGEIEDLIADVTQLGTVTARHTNQIGTTSTPNTILYDINEHEEWINANNRIANVKQYGAVGDGVTDDTTAIKAAVATGYDVYFPCLNNEIYVVEGFTHHVNGQDIAYTPIVLNTRNQTLYSDFQGRTIKFITDGADTVLFDVQKAAKIEGITISHEEHTPNVVDEHGNIVEDHVHSGIAIKATTNEGRNDTDVLIERCGISGFNKAVDYTGRGLYVARSQMTSCKTAIHLKWTHDDDPSHGDHMSNRLGHRSHRILSNRFHSLGGADATAILLESNVPDNTDPLNGILISNNMFDYSGLYFIHATCSVRYAVITNNYIGFGTYYALWFEASIYNSVIANNCIWGDADFHRWRRAMSFDNSVVGCTISDNAISNCWTNGIVFGAQVNSCSIVGNTFNGCDPNAIVANNTWNRVVVMGNSGNLASGANAFINLSSSPSTYQWNHVKIIGNSVGNASDVVSGYNSVVKTDCAKVYNFGDDV